MAVLSVYQHGFTSGNPGDNKGMAGKRGAVQGWSQAASRNNIKFLRSVTLAGLDGIGISFTLTLKDCPPSGEEWHRLRRAFLMRLSRAGMSRLHWVTEWQRRGVPHLHGVAYFPKPSPTQTYDIIDAWMAVAGTYNPQRWAQHTSVIFDALGWNQYMAKHAARGVSNYQRSSESLPAKWKKKTGRVWGHTGSWPIEDPSKLELCKEGHYRLRRIAKKWRLADARAAPARNEDEARKRLTRIKSARGMLQQYDPKFPGMSHRMGTSEWLPQQWTWRVVQMLDSQGYTVLSS
jgi:hypothetical protein